MEKFDTSGEVLDLDPYLPFADETMAALFEVEDVDLTDLTLQRAVGATQELIEGYTQLRRLISGSGSGQDQTIAVSRLFRGDEVGRIAADLGRDKHYINQARRRFIAFYKDNFTAEELAATVLAEPDEPADEPLPPEWTTGNPVIDDYPNQTRLEKLFLAQKIPALRADEDQTIKAPGLLKLRSSLERVAAAAETVGLEWHEDEPPHHFLARMAALEAQSNLDPSQFARARKALGHSNAKPLNRYVLNGEDGEVALNHAAVNALFRAINRHAGYDDHPRRLSSATSNVDEVIGLLDMYATAPGRDRKAITENVGLVMARLQGKSHAEITGLSPQDPDYKAAVGRSSTTITEHIARVIADELTYVDTMRPGGNRLTDFRPARLAWLDERLTYHAKRRHPVRLLDSEVNDLLDRYEQRLTELQYVPEEVDRRISLIRNYLCDSYPDDYKQENANSDSAVRSGLLTRHLAWIMDGRGDKIQASTIAENMDETRRAVVGGWSMLRPVAGRAVDTSQSPADAAASSDRDDSDRVATRRAPRPRAEPAATSAAKQVIKAAEVAPAEQPAEPREVTEQAGAAASPEGSQTNGLDQSVKRLSGVVGVDLSDDESSAVAKYLLGGERPDDELLKKMRVVLEKVVPKSGALSLEQYRRYLTLSRLIGDLRIRNTTVDGIRQQVKGAPPISLGKLVAAEHFASGTDTQQWVAEGVQMLIEVAEEGGR